MPATATKRKPRGIIRSKKYGSTVTVAEFRKRWLRYEHALPKIPGYDPYRDADEWCWFDWEAAEFAVHWIETFVEHVEGEWAGTKIKLEPWQVAVIGNAFGWKMVPHSKREFFPPTGLTESDSRKMDEDFLSKLRKYSVRRYREIFLFLPRKNSKTTMTAAIVNLVLFCENEPGMQVYSAGADREQASLCFRIAQLQVEAVEALDKRCRIVNKSIEITKTRARYHAISADAHTKHGFNSHLIVIDELHAQPNSELVDVLTTSTGSRRQPLIFYITTSDYERQSVCNDTHKRASAVRDGESKDKSFLPVIYEATKEDNWEDPAVWRKANPNFGISVYPDYFEREFLKAKEAPRLENVFKRLHLNIRTEQSERWIVMSKWDSCHDSKVTEQSLHGRPCYAGVDLSSTDDVTACVLVFPRDLGNIITGYDVVCRFWVPKDTAHLREKDTGIGYCTWEREGFLSHTRGEAIDYDTIERDILALRNSFNIKQIAVDKWNALQLSQHLKDAGLDVVAFSQNFGSMTAPSKELERVIKEKDFNHMQHPVLRWMATNVFVESNSNQDIRPVKGKSGEKIDGIVALIMGIGLAMVRDLNAGKSIYDDRGLLSA